MPSRFGFLIVVMALLVGCTTLPLDVPEEADVVSVPVPTDESSPSLPTEPAVPDGETPSAEPPPEEPPAPTASSAPDESLLTAPADYSDQNLPISPGFIDRVYVLDLETYRPPRGRALVAGQTYEVIAQNDRPFLEYVRFTVVLDGEETDSIDATCPEFCADEGTYSVPLQIIEGDHHEIQIIAQDASGARGESVVYQYAVSVEDAGYMAETCSVSPFVPPPLSSEAEQTVVFHGGTIDSGWPEGTNVNPYDIDTPYVGICDEVSGFFAETQCRFAQHVSWGIETAVDEEACTCECTLRPNDVSVDLIANVDFPNWAGYGAGSACEQEHWDAFLQNLKGHEEGHLAKCQQTRSSIEEGISAIEESAVAANCEAACDAAYAQADSAFHNAVNEEVNDLNNAQAEYDDNTGHGATEGATLDCNACN